MRILILSNVPPGCIGGAEVQALLLAQRWAELGHEVTVAGHANQPTSSRNLSILRISTLKTGRALRAASYLSATLWLLWRRRNDYDLIYCRFLREQTFTACIGKHLFGLPQPLIACPACASTGGDAEHILKSPLKKIWLTLLRNHVTVTNAMSAQIRQEVLALGVPHEKISSIPNGIVLPESRPRIKPNSNKLQIIFVGRLVEQKGLDVLLESARILKKAGLSFEIRIVGAGPLRPKFEEYCQRFDLCDNMIFIGGLRPEDVSEQLSAADLFVLPSRYEGFPGALLEAIAHGLPAVATRVSGSEEIIDDNIGWLIPIDDPHALANALKEAITLDRETLNTMGKKARQKASEQYDIDHIAMRYLKLFEELSST